MPPADTSLVQVSKEKDKRPLKGRPAHDNPTKGNIPFRMVLPLSLVPQGARLNRIFN
jgi:hypothetical protein